ncbi:uncharacterized protein [Euphorbia lathyris]|uniref:uncharacterized protein isoform X2 n=1 Tax=Euphorbia lathyris TaxID=212925 RepID=UPI003313D832
MRERERERAGEAYSNSHTQLNSKPQSSPFLYLCLTQIMVCTILTSICISHPSTLVLLFPKHNHPLLLNKPNFSSNFPTSTSICNFYQKGGGLRWSILKRWPWQWRTASLTSLTCGFSSVLTGFAEAAAISVSGIKIKELSMDQKAELLILDQCITTAVALGVIYSFTNTFQPLPEDMLAYGFSMSTFHAQRKMSSICSSHGPLVAQWRHSNTCSLIFLHSKTKFGFVSPIVCCSNNDSFSKHSQLGYDPSEDLLGIDADLKNGNSIASKPKSWFGPNGLYIKELPCPSCRGRGYTPCTECGIERSRLDCSQCIGKGIITCHQCLGDCVIWEESIDEQPWEKARSVSPLKVKEDDEVDNLEIQLEKKKSKRVYQTPSPEVGQKISRSLKSLNAKTGLFSKRMKIIHSNPVLHAQRVAAIKKAKGTAAARKHTSETLKAFFSDPENRHKRSVAMKGVNFFCNHCGREGHRKHYCPEFKDDSLDRRFRCRLCGKKGHNRRTCPKSRMSSHKSTGRRRYHCKICHTRGHNRRTCPKLSGSELVGSNIKKSSLISKQRIYTCLSCREKGHNVRTCPNRKADPATGSVGYEKETDDPAME